MNAARKAPPFFRPSDEIIFRLFDAGERDAVVDAVSSSHAWSESDRNALGDKVRKRLVASALSYLDRLHQAAIGFAAPDFQALVHLYSVLEQVAAALRNTGGSRMTPEQSAGLGRDVRAAWTAFLGDAAAQRLVGPAYAEIQAQARRPAASKAGAEAQRRNASNNLRAVSEAFRKLPPTQRDGGATALVAKQTNLSADTVRKHLKTVRNELKTE